MVNNRNANFIIINYKNIINKTLNQTISDIRQIPETNSISHSFIEQILPYQKFALKMAEYTARYTKNRQILNISRDICSKYPEIIKDMKEIENMSQKFKNCNECIESYQKSFSDILRNVFSEIKKINSKQNINLYFWELIRIYYAGKSRIIENLLKYRICPQLRLIAEYMLHLSAQTLKGINST